MTCIVELVYRNLISHLEDGTQHHLRLAVRRIMEQQTVIVAINKRLSALETQIENNSTKVTVVESTTAASVAAVALSTKNLSERVTEDMNSMEKKHKNEMEAIKKSIGQTNTRVGGIDQRVTRLSAVSATDSTRSATN